MTASRSPSRQTLSSAAEECLMLVQQIRLAADIGDPAQLRARTLDALKRFEGTARASGYDNEVVQSAKFALVAFFDEAVTGTQFAGKETWAASPLQAELFGLNYAGEEFFRRLNDLRQRPQANIPLLEVYYLCMVLGFKGKFLLDSPEVLRHLVEDTKTDIVRAKDQRFVQPLSPHGRPEENFGGVVKRDLPPWVLAVGAASLAFVVFLVLSWLIGGAADQVRTLIEMAG